MRLRDYTVAVLLLGAALDASAAPDWQQAAPSTYHRSEGVLIEHNNEIFVLNGFTFGLKIQILLKNTFQRPIHGRCWSRLPRQRRSPMR